MLLIWFLLVAAMLTGYVVLDGFDLGIGVLYLFVARSEEEKSLLMRTIGPVWDGNEVWLIASGGTLYFAFPLLYASAFSGFYLPLMIVLWLLILRGIGIELRSHVDSRVFRGLFDGCFGMASLLLIVFFGAAMGNVIRGVPLRPDGFFFLPLWTNWNVGPTPGILDWYTVIAGLLALAALTLHGACWGVVKTGGELNGRLRAAVRMLAPMVLVLTVVSLLATLAIRPGLVENYNRLPVLYAIPAAVLGSLVGIWRGNERAAFGSSCGYLVAMLSGAAAAMYPALLPSATDAGLNITVYNAHSGGYALSAGLIWWSLGVAIAVGYFVFVYRMFRGKVEAKKPSG